MGWAACLPQIDQPWIKTLSDAPQTHNILWGSKKSTTWVIGAPPMVTSLIILFHRTLLMLLVSIPSIARLSITILWHKNRSHFLPCRCRPSSSSTYFCTARCGGPLAPHAVWGGQKSVKKQEDMTQKSRRSRRLTDILVTALCPVCGSLAGSSKWSSCSGDCPIAMSEAVCDP